MMINAPIDIQSYFQTHLGQVRSNNEDFLASVEPTDRDVLLHSGRLYIVADGVGGAADGERASRLAVDTVQREYYRANPHTSPIERLRRAIVIANQAVFEESQRGGRHKRMATTVVAAVVRGNYLSVAWVGDSRAYLIRDGVPLQISEDHTMVAELVRSGQMTEAEAETSRVKNRLMRSVGGDEDVLVDNTPQDIPLRHGDVLVLCSDGLTRYANGEKIAVLIENLPPGDAACNLIDYANSKGGADNVSVIVVQMLPLGAALVRGSRPEIEIMETVAPRAPGTHYPIGDEVAATVKVAPPSLHRAVPSDQRNLLAQMAVDGIPGINRLFPRTTFVTQLLIANLLFLGFVGFVITAFFGFLGSPQVTESTQTALAQGVFQTSLKTQSASQTSTAQMALAQLPQTQVAPLPPVAPPLEPLATVITPPYIGPEVPPILNPQMPAVTTGEYVCVYRTGVGDIISMIIPNYQQFGAQGFYRYTCQPVDFPSSCSNKEEIVNINAIGQGWFILRNDLTTIEACVGPNFWVSVTTTP